MSFPENRTGLETRMSKPKVTFHKENLTVTNGLIILCIIVYILDKYILVYDGGMFETPGVLQSILGLCGGDVFYALAFKQGCIAAGEPWRTVTSLFIHLFILHLVVNMIGLGIAGNHIEKQKGKGIVLLVFLLTGIISMIVTNALPFLQEENALSGGASGGVFGLMGFAFVPCLFDKAEFKHYRKAEIIYLIFYGIAFTYFMGTWTMLCHNIGFVSGILLGLPGKLANKTQRNKKQHIIRTDEENQ